MTDKAKARIEKEWEEKTGKLNLGFCELDHIPEKVTKMVWLTSLGLQDNKITKIEGLEALTNLTTLSLQDNQIPKIEGLQTLTNLNRLSLTNNQIRKIEGLQALTNLTILFLQENQINKIEGLQALTNLISLFLYNNQIPKIEGLEALTNLTALDIEGNQIPKIEGLEALTNLTMLSLISNQIPKIEGLEVLTNLTTLYLQNNKIPKIEGLQTLTNLTTLDLDNNQIPKIEGLEALTNLTNLSFQNNQIPKIEGLEALTNLTTLDLDNNQIPKIEGLEALTNLTNLSLQNNQIPKIEGLEALTNLTNLSLQNNQIPKIEGLEALTNLTNLSLRYNKISKIEGLEALTNLTWLELNNNQIPKIEGLQALKNLGILNLANNPIKELPPTYQDFLSALPVLALEGVKIDDLSLFYQSIERGKKILWESFRFSFGAAPNKTDYFEFTFNQNTRHVKRGVYIKNCNALDAGLIAAIQNDTLLSYIKEPKERLFEARVLVLGEPRAGKTTLRRKLADVGAPMPTEQESTKAFEIEVTPYECEIELQEQKEKLRYHLWDFGGQDYYRLLHQLFVTEQSVYIIVVDTDRNKNEEEIAFWLDTIERLGKDERERYGPVILLQNPKNSRPGGTFIDLKKRYPFWQQTEDFAINLNALNEKEVASFNKNELVAFRGFEKYLSRSFCRLDHVGEEIPIRWAAVRNALLEEKENWISVERFHTLCHQKEIKDKKERSNLLSIFRKLGYLLHYKNTALKGMVILNREWITDALYRVLDDPIVESNKGWFVKEDAEKIWHEEKYENRTEELLALMQEFKLCYQNQITKKYIVPSKLPSAPDNLPTWDSTDTVHLRLQYDWIPKALAIQLMVSLHEYMVSLESGEQWIWRKGAVLDGTQLGLEQVQVRIRDEYEQKRISIDARGPHSETLFRIIMKKWKEVNEPFKDKVKVTPIILCPCTTCKELEMPHTFKYQSVLNAKKQKQSLQCNESFTPYKAEEILKGVYDETTVLVDSLKHEKQGHSYTLDLIKADKLEEAIETISAPEYNTLFARRLKEWKKDSNLGMLSFEQKTLVRNTLAKDLVDYFTLYQGLEPHKLERLKKMLPEDRDAFIEEVDKESKRMNETAPTKGSPSVQVIINNNATPHSTTAPDPAKQPEAINPPTKPFYKQWWFSRIVGAIIGGLIVAYFISKYVHLHFGDTWLALSALGSGILLMRNPKRVYLRWAGFCVMAISGINILSQIDVAFNITGTTEKKQPWDFIFQLGIGETPILSLILGVLAGVLFVLDYQMRKEKL